MRPYFYYSQAIKVSFHETRIPKMLFPDIPNNPFSSLPYDMKQYEISFYLDPVSRAAFNQVLKKDERVFKKFPKDYALKHQIITVRSSYEIIAMRGNELMERFYQEVERHPDEYVNPSKAVRQLIKFFSFLKNPLNSCIFKYQRKVKEKVLEDLKFWIAGDDAINDNSPHDGLYMRQSAKEAYEVVSTIPFVRHVNARKHTRIY